MRLGRLEIRWLPLSESRSTGGDVAPYRLPGGHFERRTEYWSSQEGYKCVACGDFGATALCDAGPICRKCAVAYKVFDQQPQKVTLRVRRMTPEKEAELEKIEAERKDLEGFKHEPFSANE